MKLIERIAIAGAWYAAAFERQNQLPDLAELLDEPTVERKAGPEPMSDVMIAHNLTLWRAALAPAA